jgi:co-chaperonin GroES (HSP10)
MTQFVHPEKGLVKLEMPAPLLWRIMIEPLKIPSVSEGGIAIPDDVAHSARFLTNIGRVAAMGALCYQSTTKSGLAMKDEPNVPKVGSWVMYGRYSGQKVETRDGREYIFVNDDEIIATIADPQAYQQYI